jgi:O-antigen/teichoic acid export membrane protein
MGIVQRQAITGGIYTYMGVFIGFISAGILFPKMLKTEEIGLLSVMVSYALILSQISSLGFISTTTRMFSYFRDPAKKHNGFLFLAFSVTTTGLLLSLIIFFVIKPYLIEQSHDKSVLFAQYVNYIVPLVACILYFNILDHYYKVLFNAVIGVFLKELLQRILILVCVILYYFKLINFGEFVLLYIGCFALPTGLIILSLISIRQFSLRPQLNFMTKDMVRTMASMSLFGIISASTGVITINIDRIMIDKILGLSSTGIYTTMFFFGTLVILPSRPLLKISSALIADAWKNNDMDKLQMLYSKSSLNQIIIGLFILIGLWVNINNIYKVEPSAYETGRYVVLFIGIAYLIDMAIGVNTAIVAFSKYYRLSAVYMVIWVTLIVLFNLYLIPRFGIVGSALAMVFSKLIVNTLTVLYVYLKFGMQPFSYKFLLILLTGGVAYLAGYFIPEFNNFILDFLIRSSVVTLIYGALVLSLRLSDEINQNFQRILVMIHLRKK